MNKINPTYLRIATKLQLAIVYPVVLFASILALAIVFHDALMGYFPAAVSVMCIIVAYLLNKGMGNSSWIGSKLFDLCVLSEIPHHNDGKAGLGYLFIFLFTGLFLAIVQAILIAIQLLH